MSDHQTADHAVKIAGITCLVRNAKCLDAAHGLFRQVGVIKDDKIRRLWNRTCIEVHPVVHDADDLGLVIIVELRSAVVFACEADYIES